MIHENRRSGRARWHHLSWALPAAVLAAIACGDNSEVVDSKGEPSGTGSVNGQGGANGSGGSGHGTGAFLNLGGLGEGGNGASNGSGGAGPVCESSKSATELEPIYLAFAFDVSGSMGHMDRPNWWHDATKKWTPVSTAAKEFFEDESSTNIFSSIVFFPAKDNKCSEASYATPLVAMTELPSTEFGDALDAYALAGDDTTEVGDPLEGGAWRGNTPTLQAVNATIAYLENVLTERQGAKVALVLVTDGLPQGCTGDVDAVAAAVEAVKDTIPTYVIGVENPTVPPTALPAGWANWRNNVGGTPEDESLTPATPPDTLAALNAIAVAGGTTEAVLIDTNSPTATKQKFRETIDDIRRKSVSCVLEIPPHPKGGTFDKDKIDVVYESGSKSTRLVHDPSCKKANAWRYDDADDPQNIELCASTCITVQEDPAAELGVNFLCEPNPDIVK